MKKKLLAILPLSFLFCSCSLADINIAGWQPFGPKEESSGGKIDDVPVDDNKHANDVSAKPSAPFSMFVNETREISMTLSPSPTLDSEKTFTWKVTKGDGVSIDESIKSNKITVTALKASDGNVITAYNDYKPALTKTFTINVIGIEENDYFWQYASEDRAQFGYIYQQQQAGIDKGTAILNGVPWSFTRSEVTSLQSAKGSVGFGKGKAPETHVHLETENTRTVNKVYIEAASANSLGKLSVKVNGVTYIDKNVPIDENGVFTRFSSNIETPEKGKIELDFYTPEFDGSREEDPEYIAPGAFYLKSIWIKFNEALPDKNLTLVKDADDIVEGQRYFILGSSGAGYGFLDGDRTTSVKDNPYFIEGFVFGENIVVKNDFDKYGFIASFDENSKLNFKSDKNVTIGLTQGSNSTISITTGDKKLGWDYDIDSDNHLVMTMIDNASTLKYFAVNKDTGKFAAYVENSYKTSGRLYLFQFAE